jgi:DNA-binding CsgD family transcriptional regulator/PAS domain-containing protein
MEAQGLLPAISLEEEKKIFKNSYSIYAIINDLGLIIAATREFPLLCGYDSQAIARQNWWADLSRPECIEAETDALGDLCDSGRLQFYEKELLRGDGRLVQVRVLARRCQEFFLLELTRSLSPASLAPSSAPSYCISEAIGVEPGIVAVDEEDRVILANGLALSYLRCDEGRIIGEGADSFFAPEARIERGRAMKAGDSVPSRELSMRIQRRDGSHLDSRLRYLPIFSKGSLFGSLLLFFPLEEGGAKPELYPLLALDGLPLALCSLRPDGSVRYINAFGRSFLSIGEEDIESGAYIFDRLREGSVGRCRTMMDQAAKGVDIKSTLMEVVTPEGERKLAIWCFGWDRLRDGLIALILDAKGILSSSILPEGEFYSAHGLTAREAEAADSLILGYEYKEIAERMGIGITTVRTHIQGIYSKLDIHSRIELIEKAGEWRIENGGEDILGEISRLFILRA